MKKIMITAYSLQLGGIEKALINLLQLLDKDQYQITLVLEKVEGIFLDQVPEYVEVLAYHVSDDQNVLIRKLKNRLKLWKWKLLHKNQYDFAISFATYSRPGAHIALNASKHHALWVHNNYEQIYEQDAFKIREFFMDVQASRFEHLVFVSYDNKEAVCKYIPEFEKKSLVCNNIIDYKKMYEDALETVEQKHRQTTFLNVGRHEEHQKRLTRIISASKRLVLEGYRFEVWFVGEGEHTLKYQEMVKEAGLQDTILFLGKKSNPFPYYKLCDAVVLSSMYEGYPVVFVEAMTMHKPLITTKVSDYKEIEAGYGIVTENSEEGVYLGMKEFLDSGYSIQNRFDPEKFNQEIIDKLVKLIIHDEK